MFSSFFPKSQSASSVKEDQNHQISSEEPKKLKPCCACPETKKERDECILLNGNEESCLEFIEKHKACMRSYGFNV